jgi:hypothetical protein
MKFKSDKSPELKIKCRVSFLSGWARFTSDFGFQDFGCFSFRSFSEVRSAFQVTCVFLLPRHVSCRKPFSEEILVRIHKRILAIGWKVGTWQQINEFANSRFKRICKGQSANFAKCEVAKHSGVGPQVIARGHVGGRPRKRS